MGKVRVGNKQNSFLNGEWAGHVKGFCKKITSRLRRHADKEAIYNELQEGHRQYDPTHVDNRFFLLWKDIVYLTLWSSRKSSFTHWVLTFATREFESLRVHVISGVWPPTIMYWGYSVWARPELTVKSHIQWAEIQVGNDENEAKVISLFGKAEGNGTALKAA